jgi:hypothetical protein
VALSPIPNRALQPAANPTPPSDPRTAAQRAFFEGALAKVAPTAGASAQTESGTVQPAVTRLKDEREIPRQPERILRPGSIIDIKV